jgi:hypothetical protein
MITINKTLTLKYKLAISVYESMNKAAYATQTRSLGTNQKQINILLSHPTFCDSVLPVIIGNNKNNSDWEREKQDYISSTQIAVPVSGYPLDLNCSFDIDNVHLKGNIEQYIKDNAKDLYDTKTVDKEEVKVIKSDKDIALHIINNLEPIEYHKYFRYINAKDYLYWVMALTSNQVANSPEDADKSPNIRFFIYDDKVNKKSNLEKAEVREKASAEVIKLKSQPDLLKNIALVKNVVTFDELEEMDDSEVYLAVFSYANSYPSEFIAVISDKDLKNKSIIKKYLEVGILKVNDNNEIADGKNDKVVLGSSIDTAVKYLANPANSAEVTKYANEYKSIKK